MSHHRINFIYVLAAVCVVSCSACEQRHSRRDYTEIKVVPEGVSELPHGENPHGAGMMMPGMDMSAGTDDPDLQRMLNESVAEAALSWVVPEGWEETPGRGMRAVTFTSGESGDRIETSIVSLGGMAGGLQSNAVRWMGQIGLDMPDSGAVQAFIDKQKILSLPGGHQAHVLNFTQLQKDDDPLSDSMVAAVINSADKTIFIKMTGSLQAVQDQYKNFVQLCSSLNINE